MAEPGQTSDIPSFPPLQIDAGHVGRETEGLGTATGGTEGSNNFTTSGRGDGNSGRAQGGDTSQNMSSDSRVNPQGHGRTFLRGLGLGEVEGGAGQQGARVRDIGRGGMFASLAGVTSGGDGNRTLFTTEESNQGSGGMHTLMASGTEDTPVRSGARVLHMGMSAATRAVAALHTGNGTNIAEEAEVNFTLEPEQIPKSDKPDEVKLGICTVTSGDVICGQKVAGVRFCLMPPRKCKTHCQD